MNEARRDVGADDEPDGRGQRSETGLQRRQAQHQLQVLRHEKEVAEGDENGDEVHGQGHVEGGDAEQLRVDERIFKLLLAANEGEAERQPGRDERQRRRGLDVGQVGEDGHRLFNLRIGRLEVVDDDKAHCGRRNVVEDAIRTRSGDNEQSGQRRNDVTSERFHASRLSRMRPWRIANGGRIIIPPTVADKPL